MEHRTILLVLGLLLPDMLLGKSVRDLRPVPVVKKLANGMLHLDLHDKKLTTLEGIDSLESIREATSIDLSANDIPEVPPGALRAARRVLVLNIRDNQITKIDNRAFEGLGLLLELNLAGNKIVQISEALLAYAPMVVKLNLADNKINEVHERAFSGHAVLRDINLSGNQLRALPRKVFNNLPALEHVNLLRNRMPQEEQNRIRNEIPMNKKGIRPTVDVR